VEIHPLSGSEVDSEHDSLDEQEMAAVDTTSTTSMPTATTPKFTPLEPSVEIHPLSGSVDGEHDSLDEQEMAAVDTTSTTSMPTATTPKLTLEPRKSVEIHPLSVSVGGEHYSLDEQEMATVDKTPTTSMPTATIPKLTLEPRKSVEIHPLALPELDLESDILGCILEHRLYPLERTLNAIQQSVSLLESQSASKAQCRRLSDADDEDEEETSRYRPGSPSSKRDRHVERLKNAVLEALAANQASHKEPETADERSLELTLSELSEKNISLQSTLDEYRMSADRWRSEMEGVKTENENLRRTINSLKNEMEESVRARQNLRGKFDRLQDDMVLVTRDIARDQASWRRKEHDQTEKYNALRFAYDQEVKLAQNQVNLVRAELETKIAALESQLQNSQLDVKNHEQVLNKLAGLESQLQNSQLDVKNHEQVLNKLAGLESQLQNIQLDAKSTEARYGAAIQVVQKSLQGAAESREAALCDQRLVHERALNDLRERHARALHNASEDKQRSESHLMELMSLRDEKVAHLEDKIAHLQDKLEIAKDAARAAARAAQTAKAFPTVSPSHSTSPSLSFVRGSEIPEKISPQALRESIVVLQDQLQQRESRIEELERELSAFDKDAPAKLKGKDIEINWLRELLGVRIDELQDIVNTLSKPAFDNDTVRDAAIRLKANLEMGQQVKERTMGGGSIPFPSLASISSLAASSRSLPLAAAAAWGNWRKGRENSISSNVSESSNRGGDNDQTPSKSTNDLEVFWAELLTPPPSNAPKYRLYTPTSYRPLRQRSSYDRDAQPFCD
jgi:hypothetical protein